MKVELAKSYPLPGSAEAAWQVLSDIEAVAGCMPGAKITERIDDKHYKGAVAVKVGPASMSFRGEIEVRQLDAASRTVQLVGKGTDSTGGSVASMDLTARIEPGDAASSTLAGTSIVSMSGKAATFAGRMMSAVADQVLKAFADNFAATVAAVQASRSPTAKPPDAPLPPNAPAAAAPPPTPSSAAAPAAAAAPQLDGLALMWSVLKAWWRGLFSRKSV